MDSTISFEWDSSKADINLKKHSVSFEEAKTVFYDSNARVIPDDQHSEEEDRFIIMGMSRSLQILIVCHCYRSENEVIRIISARKANSAERKQYERFQR